MTRIRIAIASLLLAAGCVEPGAPVQLRIRVVDGAVVPPSAELRVRIESETGVVLASAAPRPFDRAGFVLGGVPFGPARVAVVELRAGGRVVLRGRSLPFEVRQASDAIGEVVLGPVPQLRLTAPQGTRTASISLCTETSAPLVRVGASERLDDARVLRPGEPRCSDGSPSVLFVLSACAAPLRACERELFGQALDEGGYRSDVEAARTILDPMPPLRLEGPVTEARDGFGPRPLAGLGDGDEVSVELGFDEPLDPSRTSLRWPDAPLAPPFEAEVTGARVRFRTTVGRRVPRRGYAALELSVTDRLGNRAEQTLALGEPLEVRRPSEPLEPVSARVLQVQRRAASGAFLTEVEGEPGAAVGGLEIQVLGAQGRVLVSTTADGRGAFLVRLPAPTVEPLSVRAVDREAQVESAATRVGELAFRLSYDQALGGFQGVPSPTRSLVQPATPGKLQSPLAGLGAGWRSLSATRAPLRARSRVALARDPVRGELLAVGGLEGPFPGTPSLGPIEAWDGAAWRDLPASEIPATAPLPGAFFDPRRGQLVLVAADATHGWNGVDWRRLAGPGDGPHPRGPLQGRVAYDPARGLGAALDEDGQFWLWSGTAWAAGPTAPIPARGLAYDGETRSLVALDALGGRLARFQSDAWQVEPLQGPALPGLGLAVAGGASELLLFGGLLGGALGDGSRSLDLAYALTGAVVRAEPRAVRPPPRSDAALAELDPGQWVLLGGLAEATTPLGDTWRFDGDRWRSVDAARPTPRIEARAACDGEGGLLVFGGAASPGRLVPSGAPAEAIAGPLLGETWVRSHGRFVLLAGREPSPRRGHALACDARSGEVLLFGGEGPGGELLSDTWILRAGTWAELRVPGPGPRRGAGLAAHGGRFVLHGGESAQGPTDETWIFERGAWSPLPIPGPGPRSRHGLAALGGGLVLAGAGAETWRFDGSTWSPGVPVGPELGDATLVEDSARARLVLVARRRADGATVTLTSTGGPWRELPGGGPEDAALGWDESAQQVIAVGGRGAADGRVGVSGAVLGLGPAGWGPPPEPAPAPRTPGPAAMTFDRRRREVVLFDGVEPWAFDGGAWRPIVTQGPRPRPRGSFALAHDPIRGLDVLVGDGETWLLLAQRWVRLETPGPSPRQSPALGFSPADRALLLFGGRDAADRPLDDTWRLDAAGWTRVPAPGPAARSGATIALVAGEPWLAGGRPLAGGTLDDIWAWREGAWAPLRPPAPGVAPRTDAALIASPGDLPGVVVLGGLSPGGAFAPGAVVEGLETSALVGFGEAEVTSPIPTLARAGHIAAWDEAAQAVIVFGGTSASGDPTERFTTAGALGPALAAEAPLDRMGLEPGTAFALDVRWSVRRDLLGLGALGRAGSPVTLVAWDATGGEWVELDRAYPVEGLASGAYRDTSPERLRRVLAGPLRLMVRGGGVPSRLFVPALEVEVRARRRGP